MSADAALANSACKIFQAATRAGGVIEAVVRLPYEGGPAGKFVSPIWMAICEGWRPSVSAIVCWIAVPIPEPISCTPE